MPYLLALASAVLYGAGDFTGGLATRRAGMLPVVVVSQLSGLILVVLLLPFLPAAEPSRADLIWGAAAGLTGGVGVALLYRALAIGRMAVVAPTTAVCAVVVPVLASFAMGERIGAVPALGIALGIGAIVLVSQQSADPHRAAPSDAIPETPSAPPVEARAHATARRLPPGVGIALISGVAIGFFFLSLARTRPEAGMWPIVASRTVSVLLFSLGALAGRHSIRMPGTLALTILCGIVDMSANALYLLAVQAGPLSVMVTLSSLYPASTVLLARVVLGEQLNTRQVTGVVCALAAIVLIVSGGPH
jgi:uncharacterized membrane protein